MGGIPAHNMSVSTTDTLSTLLIKAGILTQDQITDAIQSQIGPDDTLDNILVQKNLVSASTLMSLFMEHYGMKFVRLPEKLDVQILKLIPEHLISSYQAIPISTDGHSLTIGMPDPGNTQALDRISATTGHLLNPVGILEGDFRQAFDKYFEDTTMVEILKEIELNKFDISIPLAPADPEKSQPMGKLTDIILSQALKKRASDIHIEPQETYALLRFRVDGVLSTQQVLPKAVLPGLVSRLRVMASLDITERRIPQDGQFRCRIQGRAVDFRINIIPSRYGEKVAMRVLDRRNFLMSIDMLGLPGEMQRRIDEIVTRPNGLFLVTGSTGSGKTTTLYSIIQRLRSPTTNILTLEDPIEYELLAGSKREGGITQIQVNSKIGLTFASGLRACLRQDPDVLFVGEIRDHETAEIAISAALTGHMVLSTLHTNGSIQTLARLMDMGIEPFLLVSSLRAVVSQKLVRLLCHQCKKSYEPPKDALQRLGLYSDFGPVFYKPGGCAACHFQGYWGRTGVYEALFLSNEINELILRRAPAKEIFASLSQSGFKTLKEHGMELVREGLTSVDEVLRVLPSL